MTTTSEASGQKLTAKGLATRERIVRAAAELIYEHGAQNTSNEQIREAAGVSGSQLTRHFPTKESLVRAVLAWQADNIVARHQAPELG
ncbi:helix-turn-helix domain-containing protein, partial [Streptomyces sp. NPDC048279]|uniref:TetR/AcrR family transcriptional regulator n=1 Tax=Streptomyces sp. NPDC048279 TaxID=3154714 RepID=UPI003439013F